MLQRILLFSVAISLMGCITSDNNTTVIDYSITKYTLKVAPKSEIIKPGLTLSDIPLPPSAPLGSIQNPLIIIDTSMSASFTLDTIIDGEAEFKTLDSITALWSHALFLNQDSAKQWCRSAAMRYIHNRRIYYGCTHGDQYIYNQKYAPNRTSFSQDSLIEYIQYNRGEHHGVKTLWQNGILISEASYADNSPIGRHNTWINGLLYLSYNYLNNSRNGTQYYFQAGTSDTTAIKVYLDSSLRCDIIFRNNQRVQESYYLGNEVLMIIFDSRDLRDTSSISLFKKDGDYRSDIFNIRFDNGVRYDTINY